MAQPDTKPDILNIPPLTAEEEDALIHTRITNDERPLRRTTKKFHTYTSVAYPPIVAPPASTTSSVEEAREAFLVELANFHLLLKKSVMVCEAEARQVEEYQREQKKIAAEREDLRGQLEQLKRALEYGHTERRRKMEYDQIAEKINTFPSREELDLSISALENDMQAIRAEHETQDRMIHARKSALDGIVGDLGLLRLLGKDSEVSQAPSPMPDVELTSADGAEISSGKDGEGKDGNGSAESGEAGEENDGREGSAAPSSTASLNPTAKPFAPRTDSPLRNAAALALRRSNTNGMSTLGDSDTPAASTPASAGSSPSPTSKSKLKRTVDSTKEDGEEDEDDVEMGEVSEKEARGRKKREDLEEGEASDGSSELSEPPDE